MGRNGNAKAALPNQSQATGIQGLGRSQWKRHLKSVGKVASQSAFLQNWVVAVFGTNQWLLGEKSGSKSREENGDFAGPSGNLKISGTLKRDNLGGI